MVMAIEHTTTQPQPILPLTEGENVQQAKEPTLFELARKPDTSDDELVSNINHKLTSVLTKNKSLTEKYFCLGLLDEDSSITNFELDRIFQTLKSKKSKHPQKDILLILLSPGGSIEPAYQISKLCKQYAKDRFVVAVPRQAKSAATLLALGADEIHLGRLGHLGPIDPQIGGLPALGVVQALESLANVVERHPGSAEMFARYLQRKLTVEQIGYCERIAESATQYAQRLLNNKISLLPKAPKEIAEDLVREYKDHGFVIDLEEAQTHLGSEWLRTETEELRLAEEVYDIFEEANLIMSIVRKNKYVSIAGNLARAKIFNKA